MRQLQNLGHPHEMTVEEYLNSNIDGRTELLGGIVFDVSPRNEPHRYAVRQLGAAFRNLDQTYIVQIQDSVAVPNWKGKDSPEIDVAVIANKFYRPIPTATDSLAFIEVSDTTYRCDRDYKIPLYVGAGVPSWIVNITERWVEFYGSGNDLALTHGQVIHDTFEVFGVTITVDSLFDPEFGHGHATTAG
jgi:hypothetical protein